MSGHSKWASIRHKKGATDAKRGKMFTKHAKLIEIAAREGGSGDSNMNPRLATAIENAKADNVPNANIDRAIRKGTGVLKGEQTVEVVYEAYGPGNTALIIECLTDNKNRTLSSVRATIEKKGGRWAEGGSVIWMFLRKGVVVGKKEGGVSDEEQLALIDAGADDIEVADDIVSVTCPGNQWPKVRDSMKGLGCAVQEAGLKYVAKQEVRISGEQALKLMEFIDAIEEDEDVSEVHTNANIEE